MIFVDTNILLDIATGNRAWADWSRQAIVAAHARGPLLINAIVYAEFAIGFEAQSQCDAEIEKFDLTLAEIPKSAAFRAAQAFRLYRRAGGVRAGLLYRSARQRSRRDPAHARRATLPHVFS